MFFIFAFGILGDSFDKLFSFLKNLFGWIGDQLRALFQVLINLLIGFFNVIYMLIDGFFYFLFSIGLIAVKLFAIFFQLGKLLIAVFVGLGKTLASFTYITQSSSNNGYSGMLGKLFTIANDNLQLTVIAYILLFSIWFIWVISAIKLLSSIRVGGD